MYNFFTESDFHENELVVLFLMNLKCIEMYRKIKPKSTLFFSTTILENMILLTLSYIYDMWYTFWRKVQKSKRKGS